MPLSERELQKPYLPARAVDLAWGGSMTRIESSFYRGDMEEMQQWLDSGVLDRLMRRERKTTIPYHDALPSRLLEGAVDRLRNPPYATLPLDQSSLAQWWERLMQMRTHAQPLPVSQWLSQAALLPLDLADAWIGQGFSPHAAINTKSSKGSPFLMLLQNALPQMTRGASIKGWSPLSDRRALLFKRLDQWAQMPGMTPAQATDAMTLLLRYAIGESNPPGLSERRKAWLEGLQFAFISQGAECTRQMLSDIVLPSLAPRADIHVRPGGLAQLDRDRLSRENARVSEQHQEWIARWVSRLVVLPAERDTPWHANPEFLGQLMAMDQGDRVLRPLLEKDAQAWDTLQAINTRFFHPYPKTRPRPALPETADRQAARIANLSHFVGEDVGCISPPKVREWACDCIRQHSGMSVQVLAAWLDCVGEDNQQKVADTWLRSCTFLSPTLEVVENLQQGLVLLHDRRLLSSLLCPESEEEGGVGDLNHVREGNWHRWLLEKKFAPLLCALPPPFGPRAQALQLFFIDETMSAEDIGVEIAGALAQSNHLLTRAISFHLDRITEGAARRAPGVQAIVSALAQSGARAPDGDCPALWSSFALRSAPRWRDPGVPLDILEALCRDLNALAPAGLARGEPFRQWCKEERVQHENGYPAQDPTIVPRWNAMQPLLDNLEAWGAELPFDLTHVDLPFTRRVEAMAARQKINQNTPAPQSRPRPRF